MNMGSKKQDNGANQRAVLVVNKRNETRKFTQNIHSIMANLNLGQDVAKKRGRKQATAHIVANSYPVSLRRYGSPIKTNPSGANQAYRREEYA